jgi:hypothetical protein
VKFACHSREETPYPAAGDTRLLAIRARARARRDDLPFLFREDGRESTARD